MRQGASPEVAAPAATLEVYVWYEADPADDDAVRAAVGRLADAMVRGGSDPMAVAMHLGLISINTVPFASGSGRLFRPCLVLPRR